MDIEECKLCAHRKAKQDNINLIADTDIGIHTHNTTFVDFCDKCIPNKHFPDLGYVNVSCPACGFNNGSINRGLTLIYNSIEFNCNRDRFGECFHRWSLFTPDKKRDELKNLISLYYKKAHLDVKYFTAREMAGIREYEILLDDREVVDGSTKQCT